MKQEHLKDFIYTIYNISGKVHQIRNMNIWLANGLKVNTAILYTLDVIESHEGCNMSEISKLMGLTKGATSQMANKLEQKGLIRKEKKSGNGKDIFLSVTDEGRDALKLYYEYHEKFYASIFDIISQYSEEEEQTICDFLNQTSEFFNQFKRNVDTLIEENRDNTTKSKATN